MQLLEAAYALGNGASTPALDVGPDVAYAAGMATKKSKRAALGDELPFDKPIHDSHASPPSSSSSPSSSSAMHTSPMAVPPAMPTDGVAAVAGPSSPLPPVRDDVVYLVDGQGYIFRAYYAMRRLTTSKGVATNAVFGFTTMLLKILKELKPTHLTIVFDPGGKTTRHAIYPEYKGTRSAMPEDLPPQIPLIHRLVDTMRIPKVVVPGWEADDVLATLAKQARAQGKDVVIITGDKDLMQLVDEHVSLLDEMRMGRGQEGSEIRSPQVIDKFGVPPHRVVDVLALAGDASDNIPGVQGIGEKTAAELVNAFGDLEQILARIDEIKQPSRREKLKAQADQARLSKELVIIRDHAPIPPEHDVTRYEGPDVPALRAFFEEMEFRRLLTDPIVRGGALDGAPGGGLGSTLAGNGPKQTEPPSELSEHAPSVGEAVGRNDVGADVGTAVLDARRYRSVGTLDELDGVVRALGATSRFAVRTELDRPGPGANLIGVAVAWGDGEAAWLSTAKLGHEALRAALAPVLTDPRKHVVAHEGKADVNALYFAGYPTWTLAGDPMLCSYLLDADAEAHTLSNLARRFLGHHMVDPDALFGRGKAALSLDALPDDKQTLWACEGADAALRCADVLEPRLKAEGLDALYRELELPLEALLGEMERAGIRVDGRRLQSMSVDFAEAMSRLQERAFAAAGRSFNLDSPKQIAELLFRDLGLPIIKRTATGPSTDVEVLEELSERHELPALILEFRTLAKLKGTYVDKLPALVDATGRVHTTFDQARAATGRLSSRDPNLQNIPVRTELGRKIRDAFIADEGNVLLSLDYSQIELRVLAHVTGDEVLVDAFQKNEDVHRRTASEVFHVSYDAVTKEQRNAAKAINFGLLYGMGVARLARELGIPRAQAKAYHEAYNARLVGVRDWQGRMKEQAYVDREVRTILGRRRKLHGIDSKNGGVRAQAERLAMNTPIQGSAADIMKRAMLDADRALKAEVPTARILLQVHDELVVEVPREQAAHALAVGREAMQRVVELKVPLVVDGAWGVSWNEAH